MKTRKPKFGDIITVRVTPFKKCKSVRTVHDPRTGEPIEFHFKSKWWRGPYKIKGKHPNEGYLIVGQILCPECLRITNFVKLRPAKGIIAELKRLAKKLGKARGWTNGKCFA
jgi:hypothetical protein